MPEGPEIHRTAAQLHEALARKQLARVEFGLADLKPWEKVLTGRRVRSVQARGKALLTHFDGGHTLYSHNQLYGIWHVVANDAWPETNRSLRVLLENKHARALLYSASDIQMIATASAAEHPYLSKLGPDLLDPKTTARDIVRRLQQPAFAGRRLGGLLLDQSAAAGMGNYLRSEVLFGVNLHPDARPKELTARTLERLARMMLTLANRSFRTGGVTAPPRWATPKRRSGRPFEDYRFMVFGKSRQPCPRCQTSIMKETISGRRLYRCPNCQPTP